MIQLYNGDCLEVLKKIPTNSVDSIVTDPPYGLSFMGKKWDYEVPSVEIWKEVLRVLKHGGHLLSFAGSRTYHRMAVNIEDAGFEIRDQIMWVFGSGFPKSLNIGKSVDKLQGNEREVTGTKLKKSGDMRSGNFKKGGEYADIELEQSKGSSPYEGWGTALKPAHEPIVVARKPLSEKTIALNVLNWGTGGINIDASRVGTEGGGTHCDKRDENGKCLGHNNAGRSTSGETFHAENSSGGRFPANFIHDGSDDVVGLFPETGKSTAIKGHFRKGNVVGDNRTATGAGQFGDGAWVAGSLHNDSGSASRFFKSCPYEEGEGASFAYFPKASKKDRNEGLEGFDDKSRPTMGSGIGGQPDQQKANNKNHHPTVKPTKLMQYLVRLVTPKGGTALDPFMGSGSTVKACVLEGFNCIGVELDPEYYKIAEARVEEAKKQSHFIL